MHSEAHRQDWFQALSDMSVLSALFRNDDSSALPPEKEAAPVGSAPQVGETGEH